MRRTFTLVELITVIVIIMILVGILMPTIGFVISKAESSQTTTRIKTLQMAIAQYESNYGTLPSIDSSVTGADDDTTTANSGDLEITEGTDAYEQLISLLTNATTGTNGLGNVRGIQFLEPTDVSNPNSYEDAWGQPFRVKIDTSYNNQLDGSALPGVDDATVLYMNVAIVSAGPDEDFDTEDDNVSSWD